LVNLNFEGIKEMRAKVGVDIRLARMYDAATTTCAKEFITYIIVTVPAANVLAADVFWYGIFERHPVP
jgi:hypothetical protein